MKKIFITALVASAILVGCSQNEAKTVSENQKVVDNPENEQAIQPTENEKTKQTTSTLEIKTDVKTEPKTNLNEVDSEIAIKKVVENAKKDKVLKEAVIEEKEDKVSVDLEFNKKATSEEKAQLLITYQLLMKEQYPDQQIDIKISE